LVHATRKEDRRLSAALLAAALAHTPEAAEAINGARTRMARKPAALARELLRNFPKGRRSKSRRRTRKSGDGTPSVAAVATAAKASEDLELETGKLEATEMDGALLMIDSDPIAEDERDDEIEGDDDAVDEIDELDDTDDSDDDDLDNDDDDFDDSDEDLDDEDDEDDLDRDAA
jgi:ribosomal protein L32